jgi:hypothetical protein
MLSSSNGSPSSTGILASTPPIHRASGLVSDRRTRGGLAGLRIEAWDAGGVCPDLVACTFSDADGTFELGVSDVHLVELGLDASATLYLRVFRGTHLVVDTKGSTAVWHVAEEGVTVRLLVDVSAGKHDGAPPAPFVVRGRLLDGARRPLAGQTIKVFDRNLGIGETLLGHAVTDQAGRYEVQYNDQRLGRPSKHQADLVVRAVDPAGAALTASDVICHAPPTAIVDLTVGAHAYRGPSEYDTLAARLRPALGEVDPVRLTDDEVRFLACSTGADPAQVSTFVAAHRLASELAVTPQVTYALARDGAPANHAELLGLGPATLRRILQTAVDGNFVPAEVGPSIDSVMERLQHATVQIALQPQSGSTGASLGDLLATVLPARAQQEDFLATSLSYHDAPDAFWQALAERPTFKDPAVNAALQFTLQIGALTGNRLSLVQKLQRLYRAGTVRSVADLARFDEADWLTMIAPAHGENVAMFGSSPASASTAAAGQDAKDLAASLAAALETAFPTVAVAHRLARDPVLKNPDVISFFQNNPAFSLGTTRLATYLAANPNALAGAADPATLELRLQGIERLFKVAPRWSDMRVLMADGIHSAQGIVRMGRSAFRRRYGAVLGAADDVFDRATWAHAAALTLAGRYQPTFNPVHPYVLRAKRDAEAMLGDYQDLFGQLQADASAAPNWASLFGPLDYCSCTHCRSVYSPSAYLVDLLQFLDRYEAKTSILVSRKKANIFTSMQPVVFQTQKTARDVLLERRPDIAHIELCCENSDTPVPYVDLVNEVLTYAVANFAPPQGTSFAFPSHITTIGTADELAAVPQPLPATGDPQPPGAASVSDAAYSILAMQPYPHDLPFNVWAEEARVYFEHLGVPRHRLMETFPAASPPTAHDIEAEYLGLSSAAWALIITDSTSTSLRDVWGLGPQDDPNVALRAVPELLQRAGLTYADLLELLDRRYVNPDALVTVGVDPSDPSADAAGCDVSKLRLLGGDAASFGLFLDRAQRFLRLYRALGWTMVELDKTIGAFKADLSEGFLVTLSQIARLRADLDVPLIEMLSWWAPLDAESTKIPAGASLYAQLFLDKAVANPPDPAFDPLPDDNQHVADHVPTILGALRTSAADLAILFGGESTGGLTALPAVLSGDTLNLDALSRLFRHVSLSRALGISLRDLLVLKALTGLDPFDATNLDGTRSFVAAVRKIQRSRFTSAEVDYLLRHIALATSGVAPELGAVDLLLDEIQDALDKLAAETAVAPDPTGELTQKALAALLPAGQAADLVAVINGSSDKPAADQAALVNELAAFLTTTEVQDIQAKLVGPSAIAGNKTADRFACVLGPVTSYLRDREARSLVKQRLSAALKLPPQATSSLLTQILTAQVDAGQRAIADFLPAYGATRDQQRGGYLRLQKAATIITRMKLTPEELAWIATAGWLDLNALPVAPTATGQPLFGAWERLVDFAGLRDAVRSDKAALLELLRMAAAQSDANGKPIDGATYLPALAQRAGWDLGDLTYLAGAFGWTFPGSYTDERNLLRLKACFDLLKRLGLSASTVVPWASADPPDQASALDATRVRGQSIKSAVKAKYDEDTWKTVAKPLTDVVREKQRAALVSYLTWKNGARTSNDLLARYLVDVEMAPCQMTSRIAQAIGSVQLFVQRCFLHLEDEVDLGVEAAEEWKKWRGRYRFWEANRKVFLYPENWIEPELRDDKTPFFEDLESEILQHDLTSDRAEDAVRHYLEKLDQVARLEVAGVYRDKSGGDVLHVFGRTSSVPHAYYHRRREGTAWTPWEKVDVDIPGDVLLPVVWNRRLYLFWPVIREVSDQNPTANRRSTKHIEIQLAWSMYSGGRWSAKRVADTDPVTYVDVPHNLFFTCEADDSTGELRVGCFASLGYPWSDVGANGWPVTSKTYLVGEFRLTNCSGKSTSTSLSPRPLVAPLRFPLGTTRDGLDFVRTLQDAPDTSDPGSKIVPLLARRDDGGSGGPDPGDGKGGASGSTPKAPPLPPPPRGLYLPPADWQSGDPVTQPDVVVLRKTPTSFRLSYAHQEEQIPVRDSFFFEDKHRTFYVSAGAEEQVVLLPASRIPMPSLPVVGSPVPLMRGSVPGPLATSSVSGAREAGTGTTFIGRIETWTAYRFEVFYHPYACEFVRRFSKDGIDGLLGWSEPRPLQLEKRDQFFQSDYDPVDDAGDGAVVKPYPIEDIDFSPGGAYAIYNWELFFHIPLLIATRLSQNQRFEEAQRWFHFIFDPTTGSSAPAPSRFWKVRPFYENTELASIQGELSDLAQGKDTAGLSQQIAAWQKDPFNPHLIARMRLVAYQKTVVMKYLDNLIAWADQLFRRDSMEAINEATQLYILASDILGPRPREISPRVEVGAKTYEELAQAGLDELSDPLVQAESWAPPAPTGGTGGSDGVPELPRMLYFCVPPNDNLLAYWDTVSDRLFKIRHCMNIEGVVRQLPLYEPPIDPALLVQAAALGVDIGSVLDDLNAPMPYYRFHVMIQKANELVAEARSLGVALLAAYEKRDGEELSRLRSTHEIAVLSAIRQVKASQVDEAQDALDALERSREVVEIRHAFYKNMPFMNASEIVGVTLGGAAATAMITIESILAATSGMRSIPTLSEGEAGLGPVMVTTEAIGEDAAESTVDAGRVALAAAAFTRESGAMASMMGSYARRWEDRTLQENLAAKELEQIDAQIAAAKLRLAIAQRELDVHDLQIDNARAVDDHLKSKFTSQELYTWLATQTSAVYFQAYTFAYDVARRAERAYRFERGVAASSYIRFGYWDGRRDGLLAAERLALDLKRLEAAYLEQNRREYEIVKSIPLSRQAPLELLKLKETGTCSVSLSETLFDLDYPGHYMRRIKSVSLLIPNVAGPYTSVNCKLTLVSSKTRIDTVAAKASEYNKQTAGHVVSTFGVRESIVTSTAQNDAGLFELSFHDERYLPFEGAGAISSWQIEMPKESNSIDFSTVTDVVLRISYTARDGGDELRGVAEAARQEVDPNAPAVQGITKTVSDGFRLFRVQDEFPNEWFRFFEGGDDPAVQKLSLALTPDVFQPLLGSRQLQVVELHVLWQWAEAYEGASPMRIHVEPPGEADDAGHLLDFSAMEYGSLGHVKLEPATKAWPLVAEEDDAYAPWVVKVRTADSGASDDVRVEAGGRVRSRAVRDVWLVCRYQPLA